MKVELVFDGDCPNVEAARASLKEALAEAGLPSKWKEWERTAAVSPEKLRGFGSPSVLINGVDVAGEPPAGAVSCRVYRVADGRALGAPTPGMVGRALREARAGSVSPHWRRPLPIFAAAGVSLLPKLACPACWPAYAGLLSSLGLGFLVTEKYLLPITAAFLMLAVALLGWRAKSHRGYGPMLVGFFAGILVLGGKFAFGSNALTYAGVAILVFASLWNSWPRRAAEARSCPVCADGGANSINMAQRS